MFSVFVTILPVFLILGAGYLLAWIKYLPDKAADALNTYALKLGVPILLFIAMYRLDFSRAFDWRMLLSFYGGAVFAFYAGMFLSRLIWKRRPGESVAVGFCAVFSNTLLIGFPIAQLVFGDAILAPVFGIVALHASLLYTLGMTTMEFARQDGRGFMQTAKAAFLAITANPLMVGILAGLAFNFLQIPIAAPLEQALDMISVTAIPVSLVGIGIALNRYSISAEWKETVMVCALALFVHPSITFILAYWVFNLDLLWVQAAVILAAMPPGMNIYIFATIYQRATSLSASVLVIGNVIAVFTIPVWIYVITEAI